MVYFATRRARDPGGEPNRPGGYLSAVSWVIVTLKDNSEEARKMSINYFIS
jgi:hypothetical protein